MRPEFGNSKILLKSNVTVEDHVEASAWLNITDESLRLKLVEYFNKPESEKINVVLQKRTGEGYEKKKVATFKLFINKPKEENNDDGDIL